MVSTNPYTMLTAKTWAHFNISDHAILHPFYVIEKLANDMKRNKNNDQKNTNK
jgi:hypothetical protein